MSTFPNYSVSGNMDWVASQRLFFGIRGGYYMSDQHDTNVTEQPLYRLDDDEQRRLPRRAGSPAEAGRVHEHSDQHAGRYATSRRARTSRPTAPCTRRRAASTSSSSACRLDRVGNNVLSGESRPRVTLRWDTRARAGDPLAAPTATTRFAATAPTRRRASSPKANIHTTNIGLFVQDAWTIDNKLTVNVGVRTERERVPTYTTGADIPEFGIEFGFKDKLAPRAGFAYDINGDGKWKAFGSWGVFYDIFKLELPRGSFGGDKWLEYYYTLDTFDWPNLAGRLRLPAGVPRHAHQRPDRLPSPVVRLGLASTRTSSRCGSRKRPSASIIS